MTQKQTDMPSRFPSELLAEYQALPGKKRPAGVPLPWDWLEGFRNRFTGAWPVLPTLFSLNAERFPDRWCFSSFAPVKERYTWQQARTLVEGLAGFLAAGGIVAGDRVVLCGKNSPAWALSYLAILTAGAVVVPLDASLDGPDLQRLFKASGARTVMADGDRISAMGLSSAGLAAMTCLDRPEGDGILWKEAATKTTVPPAGFPVRTGSDLAAILYTSGTTGTPKGVMLSHDNLVSDCFLAQYLMELSENDVFYALLPIHHSYTMLAVFIEALSVGAETVFGRQLVIKQVLSDFREGRVTMFLAVPLLFNRLLDGIRKGMRAKGPLINGVLSLLMALSGMIKKFTGHNPGKHIFRKVLDAAGLTTLRICISGGGPLSPRTFRAFNQLGLDFVQGYGLTETSPIIALNPVWLYDEGSVGAMVPGTRMRILDPDAQGRGEILVKGPMVMQGYYLNPEATAEVLDSEGWFHTGDAGYIDSRGYVYLTGRIKNIIVTEGGKNVYPEEIEYRFEPYFDVDQVLVRGYVESRDTHSESIEVLLHPSEDRFRKEDGTVDWEAAEARMEEVVKEVNVRLPAYAKIGRWTVLRESMEMTSTRKIKRFRVA